MAFGYSRSVKKFVLNGVVLAMRDEQTKVNNKGEEMSGTI